MSTDAAAAIRHHYDVSSEFYKLWLDDSLTYSCARRGSQADTLAQAQENKLRYHLDAVGAANAGSVLDIGCGWGSILARLPGACRGVGLTLSDEQAAYIARHQPAAEVRVENWTDYEPGARFDGIISIGAFEHFATPADSPERKVRRYRDFFTRCRDWLTSSGALSLQTIAYADMSREDASAFMQQEIFPGADLPTLAEITTAADRVFEVQSLENGRLDYAWTCAQWARRLRARRPEAVQLVGPEVVARYERYLKMSALGFGLGKIALYRLVLRPSASGWTS
ncbi:class I SAM-dependent methyltransferase [Amycolatopsis acidicola]|uniref:Class I SAM-dependent methyltransferase n=1 Tax=Amycolatopsis acidicola TaxID=2596893 RepID=A0A5N0UZX1_9PSEU|nr:cyclopropane-fatty-acyl-phospholipid synthase family protein [Amycolatopsis acidicola]KAA9159633.1 class I SAM-dependent methyltransferase [Amycolatopsis acidicola]